MLNMNEITTLMNYASITTIEGLPLSVSLYYNEYFSVAHQDSKGCYKLFVEMRSVTALIIEIECYKATLKGIL